MPIALNFTPRLRAIESAHSHLPLMQRAGAAAADWASDLARPGEQPILVLAGPGNNGGDAFEAAHRLRQGFYDVRLVFIGDLSKLPKDAAAACQRFLDAEGVILDHIPGIGPWSLIIDGLFGIGLQRPAEGQYETLIVAANQLALRDGCPLLALDCPSGINADTGMAYSPTIRATHTLTFISGKPGLWTNDGPDFCGEIRIADLAIAADDTGQADGLLLNRSLFAGKLQPRRRNTHKGSYGSVGIVGGSHGMVGAALLASRAALKLGAGRVYVGLLDADPLAVDVVQPELMLRPADDVFAADLKALAVGPGLGQTEAARRLLEKSLASPLPLVLDADALNLIAQDTTIQEAMQRRQSPVILTPHPAEAARLLACSVATIQADRVRSALALAGHLASFVALKGCGTVIAAPDGRCWINPTGNPGMASAGMGDVLTGLVASLLAQDWPAEEALLAGVHLHGEAADTLVSQGIGPIGLTAGEVIDAARAVFNRWIGDVNAPAHAAPQRPAL